MAGIGGAPCTSLLKIEAREIWQKKNHVDWHVFGYTADKSEVKRAKRFKEPILNVLIDAGMTKADCFEYIENAGLVLPEMYRLGFDNANCIGCAKANGLLYWCMIKKHFPDMYEMRNEQSKRIGCRLLRISKQRYFLDEVIP